MSAHPTFHTCERCGGRIGMYEPASFELADGMVVSGSLLSIGEERGCEITRASHRTCLEGAKEEPER